MKNFSKALEKINYRHNTTQVFDDFLEIAVCAFALGRMETRYFEIIKRYNPDELNAFAQLMAAMFTDYELCADTSGSWDDVLGNYFETINSSRGAQHLGQFFTPKSVCDLMAAITKEPITKETTVCDPCCGSGRNLIAHSRLETTNRTNCLYFGMDVDRRCINMCIINMVLYGLRGVVIHMNTLSLEIYGGYRIYLPETGLGVMPLSLEQCQTYVNSSTGNNAEKPNDSHVLINVPKQLTLL
jgi:type I restriction enzyme M protein